MISKEATAREVLAEVSVRDLLSTIKTLMLALGCYGLLLIIVVAAGAGAEAANLTPSWSVPTWVWVAVIAFFWALNVTGERSYHEGRYAFFFPKLGFFGWIGISAYVTVIYLAFAAVLDFEIGMDRSVAGLIAFSVLVLPVFLTLLLFDIGHKRLMEKRWAIAEKRDPHKTRSIDWEDDE